MGFALRGGGGGGTSLNKTLLRVVAWPFSTGAHKEGGGGGKYVLI